MNKLIKSGIIACFVLLAQITYGKTFVINPNEKLFVKVSKTGLNRISNSPYQIVQVTGDESKYRLKFDEDGMNIYLMPLVQVGEKIEISVKNNMGFVFDIELEVAGIRGQTICIKTAKLKRHCERLKGARQSMLCGICGLPRRLFQGSSQ